MELGGRRKGSPMAVPLLLFPDLQPIQALAISQVKEFYLVRVDEPGGPMVVRSRQEPRAVFERQSASALPNWSTRPSASIWDRKHQLVVRDFGRSRSKTTRANPRAGPGR